MAVGTGQPPQEREQPPGDMRKAVGTGLQRFGFAMIGSAMAEHFDDPALAAPITKMGDEIIGTLHDRWWKQEYENFAADHGQRFTQSMQELRAGISRQFNEINRDC